jgi:hypothetical protein
LDLDSQDTKHNRRERNKFAKGSKRDGRAMKREENKNYAEKRGPAFQQQNMLCCKWPKR